MNPMPKTKRSKAHENEEVGKVIGVLSLLMVALPFWML
jgi:hypothetical protein